MAQGRTQSGLYFDAERRAMQKRDREMIPTRLVYAMFAFALATLIFVSLSVWLERPLVGQPQAAPIAAQTSFVIEGSGNSVMLTAPDGTVLLDAKNGGFIAVVLDGLQRARLNHRVVTNEAVVLTAYENGRLALSDPSTGWQVELSSFGAGNRAAFERLLIQ